jgi:hypothetical protein
MPKVEVNAELHLHNLSEKERQAVSESKVFNEAV